MKKIVKLISMAFLVYSAVWVAWTNSYSAIPRLVNYTGRLTDLEGRPLEGRHNVVFKIFDSATVGNLLWQATYEGISIQKGIFSVNLGERSDPPYNFSNLTFDEPYFLEIVVDGEIMQERQRITAVGYAIRAEYAEHGVPRGVIVMWSGSISNIPNGWALCDGTNGTPDLRDRFIVGARQDENGIAKTSVTSYLTQIGDGQLPSHSHSVGTLAMDSRGEHIHSITSYENNLGQEVYNNPPAASNPGRDSVHRVRQSYNTDSSGMHTHTLSGSTATSGTGTKTIAVYYALAFIMKL